MKEFIPIAKPVIGQEEIEAVAEVLNSGMLTQGEVVKRFEDAFSNYLGIKNSIAVSNGTVALDMALKALNLSKGEEVVSPAFTFIATANSILYQDLRPVFADVDERSFNIDPGDLLEKITPKTKAVIGVHLYGHPFDIKAVQEICQDHGLALIEDCAQAHGAEYNGKKVGTFSLGCFSFYPTKNITTGEGGIVTTDDDRIAAELRLMRNHGDSGKYNHIRLGYNYRMMNLQGAIGLVQLKKLDEFNQKRIENAEFYHHHIRAEGVTKPYKDSKVKHVYNQYVILVEDSFAGSREELMQHLASNGISSAIHYPMPIYRQPLYRNLGLSDVSCPVSEEISSKVLSLPVHPSLSQQDLEHVVGTINGFGG